MAWKVPHLREFDENAKYKSVDLMSDQVDVDKKGRLQCVLVFILVSRSEFKTHEAYGEDLIYERRHRYG